METAPGKHAGGLSAGIDLDLGCLYELTDGSKWAVQALGNNFGSFGQPPHIMLDHDDRSGNSSDGENLFINGNFFSNIRRILLYTFIYEGAFNWAEANGVVTIRQHGAQDIVIRMDEHDSSKKMCGLALIQNTGDKAVVERIVRYFGGHEELDRAFNWGLRWSQMQK